ncbi:hypothetical protein [Solimicrobium silvestre]|uniref:Uncharacterized protein n=1 Tax=Solimicrobium silvestre TaxID=2099400 RepID=A0A2S9GY35_9BURK|nr:hypothetical protein [Solimicrobium silvestre]PRC92635.1 hypothetical protein S2091_2690 [Solimicrobium silvestre]
MKKFTEQDVIELFNGDQADIFKKVADRLNKGSHTNLFMLLSEEIEAMKSPSAEEMAVEASRINYDRAFFGKNLQAA